MISPADARAVATMLAGVGEVTRMRVLVALSSGPAAVGEVAKRGGVPLVNASHHLNVRRRAGVLVARKQGRHVLGTLGKPAFGDVGNWLLARVCNGLPDYVMILDLAWWLGADRFHRCALVHHELKHAGFKKDTEGDQVFTADGDPIWVIEPHDLEEFNDTVRRFGAWKGDISSFMAALRSSNHGGAG